MGQRNGFRIPTILAIALVGALITITSLVSDDARLLFGRAAQPSSVIPQTVQITNIADSSAFIYWKSEEAVASTIRIEGPGGTQTLYDTRDHDNTPKPYKLHVFSISNLPASQSSQFEIYIGNQPVYRGTIATGPQLETPPLTKPLYGSVPSELADKEKGVLISININNEAVWTTFQNSTTSWVLPLAIIRSQNLNTYYCREHTCDDNTPVVYTFTSESTTITENSTFGDSRPFVQDADVQGTTSQRVSPTLSLSPPVTASPTSKLLSRVQTPTPIRKLTTTPTPAPRVLAQTSEKSEIAILNPKEGALLSFPKPLIRGSGIAEKDVSITISGSITQIGKTKINDKGIWQWTPVYPLSPGIYKLTVASTDQINRRLTLTRSFSILKSGETVLSASTPSATLIPEPTTFEAPTTTPFVSYPPATPTLYITAGPGVSAFFIGSGAMLLLLALTLL